MSQKQGRIGSPALTEVPLHQQASVGVLKTISAVKKPPVPNDALDVTPSILKQHQTQQATLLQVHPRSVDLRHQSHELLSRYRFLASAAESQNSESKIP